MDTTSAEAQRLEGAVARLWAAIDARQEELIALIAALVRHPSPLGQEAAAQAHVADYLRAAGLAVESWDLAETLRTLPEGGDSGVPFAGRPNVAGTLTGAGGGRSLILNGHIDVVSAEPIAAWTHDPWAATIVDGRMYGRGAFDMKSGIALNLFLARLLARSRHQAARGPDRAERHRGGVHRGRLARHGPPLPRRRGARHRAGRAPLHLGAPGRARGSAYMSLARRRTR